MLVCHTEKLDAKSCSFQWYVLSKDYTPLEKEQRLMNAYVSVRSEYAPKSIRKVVCQGPDFIQPISLWPVSLGLSCIVTIAKKLHE